MKQKRRYLILLLISLTSVVWSQTTITGQVTDSQNKEALLGVLVVAEGTSIGTTTDLDGKYSISVPSNVKRLSFSLTGMITRTVDIGASTLLNIALDPNEKLLKDVVVTALNVKREQRSLGYSTTTISSDDLNRTNDRSALGELQGKVAGVNITSTNGSPGSSTRIVMRGGNSLLGNQQALIIMDGVPINNNAYGAANDFNGKSDVLNNSIDYGNRGNDINPNDIQSITVLKGPAASALYGSRGAQGAIIITTKSGGLNASSGKKFKVSINSTTSFHNILKLPEFQNEYGQGGEGVIDTRENFSWGPKFDGSINPWGQAILDDSGNLIQKVKPYNALPNNVKGFFNTGLTLNNNISIQGGTQKTNYYLSYNNLTNKGVIPTTGYTRNSVKLNAGHEFSEHLTSEASVSYIKTKGDLVSQGQGNYSVYDQILQIPRDIPVQETKDLNDPFNTLEHFYGAYTLNPYYVLANQQNNNEVDRLLSSVSINYNPLKWLGITARVGNDYSTDSRYERHRKFAVTDGGQNDGQHDDGLYSEDIYRTNELNTDLITTFNKKFKHDIGFNFLIGYNFNQRSIKNIYASTNGLVVNDFYNLKNSDGRPIMENRTSLKRIMGAYAGLDLSWKNMIFLGITARNDWSSTLPKTNRSYFYPSVNGSWVFSELIKDNNGKWLTFGKLRGGWASIGNDADPYLLTNVFVPAEVGDGYANSTITGPFPSNSGGTVPGYTISDLGRNPNLKPERTNSWEIGMELAMFSERFRADITYYNALAKDQVFPIDVAPSSGIDRQIVNGGEVSNKGIELSSRIVPVLTKSGFKWELYGTFTKNVNKVKSLKDGVDQIILGGASGMSIVARVGEAYGTFYANTAKTDDQGRIVVDAVTGQPVLTDKPQTLGNFQPKFIASWGTSLAFKGISFNILFDTKQGGKIYSRTKDLQEFVGTSPNTTNNNREDFVIPNSVIETSPGVYETNTSVKVHHQDYWIDQTDMSRNIIDASFIKLREISLSYQMPSKWFKTTKSISGVQISIFGNNLALWTPKENTFIDPETSSYGNGNAQGFEYGTSPTLRTMGFGIKADF